MSSMVESPPPAPPPPPLGFGSSGPPPPPLPPPGGLLNPQILPDRPSPTVTKDRGALLTDITKGTRLKKAVTNDRSAPVVGERTLSSTGALLGTAPPVPIRGYPSNGLAPPSRSEPGLNRPRSNSDSGGSGKMEEFTDVPAAPQLGGIFAGIGIPKLRKTGGGIHTGRDSSYTSEPETLRFSVPKPPTSSASKFLTPKSSTLRPSPQTTELSPPQQASNHLIANLRKPPLRPLQRPTSEVNTRSNNLISEVTPPRAPPPPPGTSKPAPPTVASRKPSIVAPPIPRSSVNIPAVAPPPPLGTPPRLPLSTTSTLPLATPPTPAPRPHPPAIVAASQCPSTSAPRTPPSRSTSPSPTFNDNNSFPNETAIPSLAMQAARNAYGTRQASPALPPPAPPGPPSYFPSAAKHLIASNPPLAFPSLPNPRPNTQQPNRSMLGPSSYTLSNGNVGHNALGPNLKNYPHSNNGITKIEDSRWRFQDESQLPKPREFVGASKLYRAGRGSSVPLDLSLYL